jgi:dynein light chain Tctex-type 1
MPLVRLLAVTVVLMQKNGAGLHTAAAAYWDAKVDGLAKVGWENGTMHAIATVYALALQPSPPADIL